MVSSSHRCHVQLQLRHVRFITPLYDLIDMVEQDERFQCGVLERGVRVGLAVGDWVFLQFLQAQLDWNGEDEQLMVEVTAVGEREAGAKDVGAEMLYTGQLMQEPLLLVGLHLADYIEFNEFHIARKHDKSAEQDDEAEEEDEKAEEDNQR